MTGGFAGGKREALGGIASDWMCFPYQATGWARSQDGGPNRRGHDNLLTAPRSSQKIPDPGALPSVQGLKFASATTLPMPATAATAIPATGVTERPQIDWLAGTVFALLWLEIIFRLRFEWTINPQYAYGWTVPFLAAFIFWRRLRTAPAPSAHDHLFLPVLVALAAGLLLGPVRLIQEANPDWRLLSWMMVGLGLAISFSSLYLAGGWRWVRHFAFPLLFFLVAVPWPTRVEQMIIQGLMGAVALINVELLNAIGIPAVQMGNVIEISSGFVGIDEACTGVRSLQATFMLSLFFGEFYHFTMARRIVLVLAGAFLAIFCNLVRTFLLVYVAQERGLEAIASWHDPAGMTILMACLFGLWGLSLLLGGGKQSSLAPRAGSVPRAAALPRFLLAILLGLVVIAEAGTQVWYGIAEARAAKVEPWTVQWPTDARGWKEVDIPDRAEELLRYSEGGGGFWRGEEGHQWMMYFFKWHPGRIAGLFIKNHRPDICLPATGMNMQGGVRHRQFTVNGITLPIRTYVFEDGAEILHVYYCYWDGTPPDAGASDEENWTAAGRLDAVRKGKREVGTQMLEIIVSGYKDANEAEAAVRAQLARIVQRG